MDSVRQNHDTILVSIAPISDRQVDSKAYAEIYLPTARNIQVCILRLGGIYGLDLELTKPFKHIAGKTLAGSSS